ncbi:MAG: DUF370 domain-containing protein [Oscillospiraceae bacterium]
MYIHLGSGTVVQACDIIGIFDIDYCSTGKRTREFLTAAQQNGEVVTVSPELPKSFIVCEDSGKTTVYISGISPATLKKRTSVKLGAL